MTRDLKWGVPLPKELGPKWEGKVMYVWVSCTVPFLFFFPSAAPFLAPQGTSLTPAPNISPPVRCTDRLSVNHCQLHGRVEAVVAEPGECQALPVHGQGELLSAKVSFHRAMADIVTSLQDNGESRRRQTDRQSCSSLTKACHAAVPFHTVLFPGYLIGSGDKWTMLDSISTTGASSSPCCQRQIASRDAAKRNVDSTLEPCFARTEYLQYEGTKFSKSKNIGVFGQNARETGVPASVWRYYLLQNRPESNDSEFTWDDFVSKVRRM